MTKLTHSTMMLLLSAFIIHHSSLSWAQEPPHMITQHLTHEDDINWYHEQTLSDGTAKTVTIPKPTPPIPWVSWRLIATNDQPVQVEYVYLVTREDQTTFTNAIRRVKTQRERAEITLPPMPVIARPDPGAADVYGHIAKQAIEKKGDCNHRAQNHGQA